MLMLSEPQIEIVMTAAGGLPAEKRGLFVERVAARLQLNGAGSLPPISMRRCARRCRA